eukprot:scaffold10471_cov13-Tisochrysis_lutea.AAC.1
MICAAYVHGGKVCLKKAVAYTVEEDYASNIVHSIAMFDIMEPFYPEKKRKALSGSPQRGH